MAARDANSRNSVTLAILVPKTDEWNALCCAFGLDSGARSHGRTSGGHFYWETTVVGMQVVIVLLNGQGNSLARGATEQVLSQFRPRLLFLLGTAAGRFDETQVYDVVASQKVFDFTEWKFQPGNVTPRIAQISLPSQVSVDMERFVTSRINNQQFRNQVIASAVSLCKEQVPDDAQRARFGIHYKFVASSNALNLDENLLRELWSSDDRLRAIDMESAGFGEACCAAPDQPQWMVIRGVSDFGTPESKKQWRRPIAALAAAMLLREFVERGLIESRPHKVDVPEVRKAEISAENYYREKSFSSFLVNSVQARLGVDLSPRRIGSDITFEDLVAVCSESKADRSVLRKKLEEIRESYFTDKYLNYEDQNDLRQHVPYWDNEVHDVYKELGIGLGNCIVLYAGIGTGRDLSRVCAQAARIIGVDVSAAMLEKAKKGWPALEAICESAESLGSIQSGSIDLYLSLRTYQSSLFDVEGAVREAYRVMKPGAGLVISIPNGFVERRGETIEVIRGLLVPNSDRLMDPERPRQIALRITRALSRLGFEEVGIMERKVDIYIRGRKANAILRNVTASHGEERKVSMLIVQPESPGS